MGIHDLKPCPFCGGEAEIVISPTNQEHNLSCYAVHCKRCYVMIGYADPHTRTTEFYKSPRSAAEMWNTRTYII